MRRLRFLPIALLVFSFFLVGCEFEASVGEIEVNGLEIEGGEVELSPSEPMDEAAANDPNVFLASEGEMPLRASFLSDFESFAYHLNYDGLDMTLVGATQFEGASDAGVSFHVQGGGQITTASFLMDDFDVSLLDQVAAKFMDMDVYMNEVIEEECVLMHAYVPFGPEVFRAQLRTCEADDRVNAQIQFEKFLKGLELEVL